MIDNDYYDHMTCYLCRSQGRSDIRCFCSVARYGRIKKGIRCHVRVHVQVVVCFSN